MGARAARTPDPDQQVQGNSSRGPLASTRSHTSDPWKVNLEASWKLRPNHMAR